MNAASPMAAEARARAPASAWYALGVLVLTTLFAYVDKQILSLIAPSLQTSLGFSDLQLGALQGLGLAIFASIASYPFGWLADRFGRRLLLAIGAAIWSASTAFCAFQSSFSGLFLGTIGVAIGEAGLGPIIFALIPDLFPRRQRNSANFIYFAAAVLGAAAGMALGGATLVWIDSVRHNLPAVLAAMETWRLALLIVAAPGPLFVALILSIRVKARHSAPTPSTAPSPSAPALVPMAPFAKSNWKTLAGIFGAIAAYALPVNCTFVWLPVAIPRAFGTDAANVGVNMGIAIAIGSIIGLLLPAVANKLLRDPSSLQSVNLARVFLLLAMVPSTFLIFASSPWHVYAAAGGQAAFGLATASLMPGILQDISPQPLRARILAMLGIANGISAGLSPFLVGVASDSISGTRDVLTAIVVVGLPGWLASFALLSFVRMPMQRTINALDGEPGIAESSAVITTN